MRALAWLLVAPCLALVPPRGVPRRRLVLRSSYVDEVTTFLASHGVRWRRDPASDARASTLHLGDGDDEASLALRLLPSPKRLEDCLDAGSSARLTDAGIHLLMKALHYTNSGGAVAVRSTSRELENIRVLRAKWGGWVATCGPPAKPAKRQKQLAYVHTCEYGT